MKLSLDPDGLSLLTRIADFLAVNNTRAYIVGGFLRDLATGRRTADIDIALKADALCIGPRIADRLGARFIPLDEINGVGRLITSELAEHPKCIRRQIDFSTIEGGIRHDLARRDFTINAMAIDLDRILKGAAASDFIDPFGGLGDIQRRIIRATSDTIFRDDAVRLLRAVRLAAELNFSINPETEALIHQDGHLINGVSAERVREELLGLLANTDSGRLLLYLDDLGLLTALIPELEETKAVQQPSEHQWDVFNHSLKVVDAVDFILRQGNWQYAGSEILDCINWPAELAGHFKQKVSGGSDRRLLLKLSALLHDIAKPQTKITNEQGKTRFLGHPQQGEPIAAAILEKLRFSSKETKLVAAVVRHHLRPVQTSHGELPTGRAIYRYFRDTGDAAIDTLFFSLADHLATRGESLDMQNWRQHTALVNYILEQQSAQESRIEPPKLINGHDLTRNFNLKPGPQIGRVLKEVREAYACQEIATRDEALALAGRLLSSKEQD